MYTFVVSFFLIISGYKQAQAVGPTVDGYERNVDIGIPCTNEQEQCRHDLGIPPGTSWGRYFRITGSNFGTERGQVLVVGKEKGLNIISWGNNDISVSLVDGTTFDLGLNRVIVRTADGLESSPMEITINGNQGAVGSVVSVNNWSLHLTEQADLIGGPFGDTGLAEGGVVVLTGTDIKQKIVSWSHQKIRIIIDKVPTRKPITFTVGVPQIGKMVYSTPSEAKVIQDVCTADQWDCNDWSVCNIDGKKTRACNKVYDCNAVESPKPELETSCTPPQKPLKINSVVPNFIHYSDEIDVIGEGFGDNGMSNGSIVFLTGTSQGQKIISWSNTKIRVSVNNAPLGSITLTVGSRESGSLVYSNASPPLTIEGTCKADEWSCTKVGLCQLDSTQTRTCTKTFECDVVDTPMPQTSFTCTYIPPACTADTWACGDWNTCLVDSTQSRSCIKTFDCPTATSPSPSISQSCTPPCANDTWSCGEWGQCSAYGNQTRTCSKTFDCPTVDTSSPTTTQICTPPPSCLEDTWSCGDWGSCSPQGVQSRSCRRVFDCSGVETASPVISQYCTSVNPNNGSQPTQVNSQSTLDHDQILKATVRLICINRDGKTGKAGSGTIIDSYGTILTNYHVVEGTSGLCRVGFINSRKDNPSFTEIADVKSFSVSMVDAALLKIRGGNNRQFVSIDISRGNSDDLDFGGRITTYGYPKPESYGPKITYTSGDFSGFGGPVVMGGYTYDLSAYFKTTAPIDHGNSGGGAYSSNGTFVGIPTLGPLGNVYYILSINSIKNWINSVASNYNYRSIASGNLSSYFNSTEINLEKVDVRNVKLSSPPHPTVLIQKSSATQKQPTNITPSTNRSKETSVPQSDHRQEEPTVIKPEDQSQNIAAQQPASVTAKSQPQKISRIKRFFRWAVNIFKR